MKKYLSLGLVLVMVFALAIPAFAVPDGYITAEDVVKTDKAGYNSFVGKEYTSNNSRWTIADGIALVSDNKTKKAESWYLDVAEDLEGTIEIAYKISSKYFIAAFEIDGAGKYYIGDAKGGNSINMVKVGKFVPAEVIPIGDEEAPVIYLDFMVYYSVDYNEAGVAGINMRVTLNKGEMLEWDVVDALYAEKVEAGYYDPARETWTAKRSSYFTFDDYAELGYDDFAKGTLFTDYGEYYHYYIDSGYIVPEVIPIDQGELWFVFDKSVFADGKSVNIHLAQLECGFGYWGPVLVNLDSENCEIRGDEVWFGFGPVKDITSDNGSKIKANFEANGGPQIHAKFHAIGDSGLWEAVYGYNWDGREDLVIYFNSIVEEVLPIGEDKEPINIGFIGYYNYDFGGETGIRTLSTSFYWQKLEQGEMIDWEAVDAAYADWMAQGGLEPDRTLWKTSGVASFSFEDYADIGYENFTEGQLETYYQEFYIDPGYKASGVIGDEVYRYLAYVELWNDFYTDKIPGGAQYKSYLANEGGGSAHYAALLAYYEANSLPLYTGFNPNVMTEEFCENWADVFESVLRELYEDIFGLGSLSDYVENYTDSQVIFNK